MPMSIPSNFKNVGFLICTFSSPSFLMTDLQCQQKLTQTFALLGLILTRSPSCSTLSNVAWFMDLADARFLMRHA